MTSRERPAHFLGGEGLMTLCRLIAPDWLLQQEPGIKKVLEGEFSDNEIQQHNSKGYNVYFLPNHPAEYKGGTVDGKDIDSFNFIFVDFDLKSGVYESKHDFLCKVNFIAPTPTMIIDSGNGVHVYWSVSDLDTMSYLRFQRRLIRFLRTDEAVGQIFQLMRLPGTFNTKEKDNWKDCKILESHAEICYTSEQLDKFIPAITIDDEKYCQQHYNRTHALPEDIPLTGKLPPKFGKLLNKSKEVKSLFSAPTDDRSKNDYRLGHIMLANGFTKDEAMEVLYQSAKAMQRAPTHRYSYAQNIVDKIWTFEQSPQDEAQELSQSVKDILQQPEETLKGTPFRCHRCIDNTHYGFRLGQVIGLVAGSGVGKTTFALNMFQWFVEQNPGYIHFFIPLEQPANEIASRWRTICGDNNTLHDKVHIMANYDKNGNFRHLSLPEIQDYILKFQEKTGKKVGCVVIDHIGALKKKGSKVGENQDLIDICHSMKAFAVQTNTLLVMQSQTSREKAGIGDLELNKDAAYGTAQFEFYVDYLVTLWQPLKRVHKEETCPTVTAFKFCKIRHKKPNKDIIQEDVSYFMYYDSDSERLRNLTQDEEVSFNYFLPKATNLRKIDKRTELVQYISVPWRKNDTGITQ